jgi:hypothetical protein
MALDQATTGTQGDDLEAAVDAAIAACDGDPRAAIRALIVATDFLTKRNEGLVAELDEVWRWVSPREARTRGE